MKKYKKELVAASTIPIILTILTKGDNYGYAIIKEVMEISDGKLEWKEGSLYPVLTKLEKGKYIRSYTKKENGRNIKYYSLVSSGSVLLKTIKEEWKSVNKTMNLLWKETNLT